MYLIRLYSEPEGLFKAVSFKDGVNFIFGKKDKSTDPKKSLNGIGKSTLLDLIDFCLLSSYRKDSNSRLFAAKKFTDGYKIVLDFEVDEVVYTIRRSFDNSSDVEFGIGSNLSFYPINDLKSKLCNLIFFNEKYKGKYSDKWLRSLIPFFAKIQKHKKEGFIDPILYIKESSVAELNQYHLFLLNIDNTLAQRNFDIQINKKQKEPALREVRKLVEDVYGLKDIAQANSEINKLERETEKHERSIKNFELASQYEETEKEANILTKKIKDIWFENYLDRKKLDALKMSTNLGVSINSNKVANLYKELNYLLAGNIKKTLDEALNFRKRLAKSREEYVQNEIISIVDSINSREVEIISLEKTRSKLFDFLETKEAIKDLTESYSLLSDRRRKLSELEGKLKTYNTLELEKLDLENEESKIIVEIKKFITEIQKNEIRGISNVFSQVYDAIYPENKDQSMFVINEKLRTDAKFQIHVEVPDMYSKGKNQGRTLIYDLTVLLNAVNNSIPGPRFLIHDGIFDSMDKTHFVYIYHYLENLKLTKRFQYIITVNEEGTLDNKFGDTEDLNPEKIAKEAVAILTPKNRLFKEKTSP